MRNRRLQAIGARALAASLLATTLVGVAATPALAASVVVSDATSDEDSGALVFDVTMSQGFLECCGDVVVDYTTVEDTNAPPSQRATPNEDYQPVSGTLVFTTNGSGQDVTQRVIVPLFSDTSPEEDETLLLAINTDAGLPQGGQARGTIRNDDGVALSVSDASALEGTDTEATVTFELAEPATEPVTITWSTGDDTTPTGAFTDDAAPNADYQPVSGAQATITKGSTTTTASVSIIDDAADENDETFAVVIDSVTGSNAAVSDGTGVITINDDDVAPGLVIAGGDFLEHSGRATFTVRYVDGNGDPQDVDADTTFQYRTEDGSANALDYEPQTSTATIPAGSASVPINVDITDNEGSEPDETFFVVISGAANDQGSPVNVSDNRGQATILNDDAFAFVESFADTVVEGDQTTVIIALDHPVHGDTTVDFRVADGDSSTGSNNATFDADDDDDHADDSGPLPIGTAYGEGNDYALTSPLPGQTTTGVGDTGTVEIDRLTTSAAIRIKATDDYWLERTQFFLFNLTGADVAGDGGGGFDDDEVEINILDNDPVHIRALTVDGTPTSDFEVPEGDVSARDHGFQIELDRPSHGTSVGVDFTTKDLNATAGSDYVASSGTVGISGGNTTTPARGTITIRVNGDQTTEPDETFLIDLAATDADDHDLAVPQLSVTILNDDITLAIQDAEAEERDDGESTTVPVTVLLGDKDHDSTITVDWATQDDPDADNPATAGDDYTADSGTLTFGPGVSERTFNVTVLGDVEREGVETFQIQLTEAQETTTGGTTQPFTIGRDTATVTILDNDAVAISIADAEAIEGAFGDGSTVDFVVTRTAPSSSPITFNYSTSAGTAAPPEDYTPETPLTNSGTIAPTEESTTISIAIPGDSTDEPHETFSIQLSNVAGVDNDVESDLEAVGTILNDDGTLTISGGSGREGATGNNGTVPFTISLANPVAHDIAVSYVTSDGTAEAGADYTATSGEAVIEAGDLDTVVRVPTIDDSVFEGDETLTMTISSDDATVGTESADGSILDDEETPRITISEGSVGETDTTSTSLPVTFTIDAITQSDVAITWSTVDGTATAGRDYEAVSDATVTIPAGESSAATSVTVIGDTAPEEDETFIVEITEAVGAVPGAPATQTIVDNETPRLTVNDTTVDESDDDELAQFVVSLNKAAFADVTFDYAATGNTATAGEDFEPISGTATIPAGRSATTINVLVYGDDEFEGTESFFLTVSDATNATIADRRGEATIVDDEVSTTAPVADAGDDVTSTEGVTVTFDGSGSSDPDGTIDSYTWTFGDGSPARQGRTVTHAFRDNGSFTVQLTVTDNGGLTSTDTLRATIRNADPEADAGPDVTGEAGEAVTLTASGRDVLADELTYEWVFGDGSPPVSGRSVRHVYRNEGTYTARVTVRDDDGGSDTDTTTVTIKPAPAGSTPGVDRSSGSGRIQTAVQASRDHWADGGAPDVVLARADKFPDALAAGPLAALLDGPLLLTNSDELHADVAAELDRLGTQRVWLLGGTAALSAGVESQLQASGYTTERLSGASRFATAATVARAVGASPSGEVILALGNHPDENRAWPDALSAGALSVQGDRLPVLLTLGGELPAETQEALADLDTQTVWIAGGTAAIDTSVEQRLTALGYEVNRLSGASRYGTSAAIATEALSRITASQVPVFLTTGRNFPDGLAAGALAGHTGGLVLLVDPETLNNSPDIRAFLEEHKGRISHAVILGGTNAVSTTVEQEVSDILTS